MVLKAQHNSESGKSNNAAERWPDCALGADVVVRLPLWSVLLIWLPLEQQRPVDPGWPFAHERNHDETSNAVPSNGALTLGPVIGRRPQSLLYGR